MGDKKFTGRSLHIKVKAARGRRSSQTQWLQRQLNDPYVKEAKIQGYRSRAAFKLLEINEKFKIFSGHEKNIIDLGGAPGSWSQVVQQLSKGNKIIAVDLLPIDSLQGVQTIEGDFTDLEIQQEITDYFSGAQINIVLSDMAANTTGHKATDHLRIIDLCEQALIFALKHLAPGGHFVAKLFQGGADQDLLHLLKINFKTVKHFKPESSRANSAELYIVAMHRK